VSALQKAFEQIRPGKKVEDLLPTLSQIRWPGRLQQISLRPLVAREEPVLLDGAHNGQSADVLGEYVDRRLRPSGRSVTWIVAASHGKNKSEIFDPLIRPEDNVAVVAFGPVDGMPWVQAAGTTRLSRHIQSIRGVAAVKDFDADILGALNWASTIADGGPLVIAGSLYLVSDVLRLLRDKR
jgi:folylpolyglutamate synthase/dihydropteroate synthase